MTPLFSYFLCVLFEKFKTILLQDQSTCVIRTNASFRYKSYLLLDPSVDIAAKGDLIGAAIKDITKNYTQKLGSLNLSLVPASSIRDNNVDIPANVTWLISIESHASNEVDLLPCLLSYFDINPIEIVNAGTRKNWQTYGNFTYGCSDNNLIDQAYYDVLPRSIAGCGYFNMADDCSFFTSSLSGGETAPVVWKASGQQIPVIVYRQDTYCFDFFYAGPATDKTTRLFIKVSGDDCLLSNEEIFAKWQAKLVSTFCEYLAGKEVLKPDAPVVPLAAVPLKLTVWTPDDFGVHSQLTPFRKNRHQRQISLEYTDTSVADNKLQIISDGALNVVIPCPKIGVKKLTAFAEAFTAAWPTISLYSKDAAHCTQPDNEFICAVSNMQPQYNVLLADSNAFSAVSEAELCRLGQYRSTKLYKNPSAIELLQASLVELIKETPQAPAESTATIPSIDAVAYCNRGQLNYHYFMNQWADIKPVLAIRDTADFRLREGKMCYGDYAMELYKCLDTEQLPVISVTASAITQKLQKTTQLFVERFEQLLETTYTIDDLSWLRAMSTVVTGEHYSSSVPIDNYMRSIIPLREMMYVTGNVPSHLRFLLSLPRTLYDSENKLRFLKHFYSSPREFKRVFNGLQVTADPQTIFTATTAFKELLAHKYKVPVPKAIEMILEKITFNYSSTDKDFLLGRWPAHDLLSALNFLHNESPPNVPYDAN